eukprot:g3151.t1
MSTTPATHRYPTRSRGSAKQRAAAAIGSGNNSDTSATSAGSQLSSPPPSSSAAGQESLSRMILMPLLAVVSYLVFLRGWIGFKYAPNGHDVFSKVSFWPPLVLSVIYLGGVRYGTRYMADRKPLNIKGWMVTYNLYQTILNAWCVVAFVLEVYALGMNWWGNTIDHSGSGFRLASLIYVHYNNKFVELLDTLFMVLRKKNKQVSVLHVYHHVMLIWAWYLVCRFHCGGDAYFGALANSFIHVVMYSYYGLALVGIKCPWKKYLTQLQLLQFAVCFAHAVYVAWVAKTVPVWLSSVQIWVMVNMLVLFGNFYRQSYLKKAQQQQKPATMAGPADCDDQDTSAKAAAAKVHAQRLAKGAEHVSYAIWKPMTVAAGYLGAVRYFGIEAARAGGGATEAFADISLVLPAVLSVGYLLGVRYGTRYMADKEPFKIKNCMVAYNLYQTILNAWCVVAFVLEVYALGMNWWGNTI